MEPVRGLMQRYKIVIALSLAVALAVVMTLISLSLYVRDGVSSLDLSRPGYEAARKQVEQTDKSDEFDATGPVNPGVINEFDKLYEKQKRSLNATDDFGNQNLSDDNLRFTPGSQIVDPE